MEGPHSPFGSIWQIASATGWSMRYILWRVDYTTLRLMLMDQPRYVSRRNGPQPAGQPAGADDGSDIAAMFAEELKQLGHK